MTTTVCFHGAESTGKSVLAQQFSQEMGCRWVPEFGRTYCEEHGTDLAMADLLAIAEGQAAATAAAMAENPDLLILDTDQLMTAAWAEMLFGSVPDVLYSYPKAGLYLLFDADVPWVDDGTRFFGSDRDRRRFAGFARKVLDRAGVPWVEISGDWTQRAQAARRLVEELRATA